MLDMAMQCRKRVQKKDGQHEEGRKEGTTGQSQSDIHCDQPVQEQFSGASGLIRDWASDLVLEVITIGHRSLAGADRP